MVRVTTCSFALREPSLMTRNTRTRRMVRSMREDPPSAEETASSM